MLQMRTSISLLPTCLPAGWTKQDYPAAVESFQKSLEIRPDRETSYGLASCLLRLKEKELNAI
jgi:hypothetical protein